MAQLIIISTGLACILAFGLGIFSLWRNPKAKVVQLWFLMSMAVTVWLIGYLIATMATDEVTAFFALRIVYFGTSLIPVLFFHFVASFLYKDKIYKYLLLIGYFIAFIFLVLTTLTKYIISGSQYLENFGYYEAINQPGFSLFLVYFLFFAVYAIYLLIKNFQTSDGIRRKQIFYILLAAIIGFGGGVSNFIMDLTGVYPYGQLIVWLYPILITYGIFVDEIKIKIKF